MKDYKNMVNVCLIKVRNKSKLVLEVIPLLELHMLMGFVNHISTYIIVYWLEYKGWVDSLGCIRRGYHGGTHEGNPCRIILKKSVQLSLRLPIELSSLLRPVRKFEKLVQGTFGSYFNPCYLQLITDFGCSYKATQEYCSEFLGKKLTVTWKIYIISAHLQQFIELTGHSLGRYNEQVSELAHSKMKPIIERFNVSQTSSKHSLRSRRIAESFSSTNL
ncbi:uncharacterized protein LOC124806873 isoform X1 [Hydra vulgaris]|uniref:uncharacterized protein LOC124806873 isoform X1 n=1 Tax=Hydra vulgaris TaxID=6087 RepID=UPI0032E9EA82